MTDVRIEPFGRARARLRVPGDKSISHRALILNALAAGEARVHGLAPGLDVASTAAALRALGARVEPDGGGAARVTGGAQWRAAGPVDCGNSGTTARLLLGVLAARASGVVTLTGDGSLSRRPMGRVAEPLREMGATIGGGDRLPLTVEGRALTGGAFRLEVASAQVKSAILLAALSAEGATVIEEPGESRDHTERMLAAMGADVRVAGRRVELRPGPPLTAVDVDVPGDFSSAAFFLARAALVPGSEVVVEDVGLNPRRTGFLDVLSAMGAEVEVTVESDGMEPMGRVRVTGRGLAGVRLEPDLVPRAIDELPLVAVLAAAAEGETVIAGAAELKVKESDRIAAIVRGLTALGADVEAGADGLTVRGPTPLKGAALDAVGDHRIGMALAVAASAAEGASTLAGAEWIDVSYPGFLDRLAALASPAPAGAR